MHSMTLCDFDIDGRDELLVGSEDFDIRVFQGDDMISEVSEAAAITSLCPLGRGRYGYALLDGIVGVYSGETRLWRAKVRMEIGIGGGMKNINHCFRIAFMIGVNNSWSRCWSLFLCKQE